MRISTRVLLGYSLPLAAMIIAGAYIFSTSIKVVSQFDEAIHASDISHHVAKIHTNVARVQAIARGLLLNPSEEGFLDYKRTTVALGTQLDQLKSNLHHEEQKQILNQVIALSGQIKASANKQVEEAKSGSIQNAMALIKSGGDLKLYNQFESLMLRFDDLQTRIESRATAEAAAEAKSVSDAVLLSIVLALLLSFAGALLIVRRIRKHLNEMMVLITTSVEQISATTEEHERTMERQASSVAETYATVDQVTETAKANTQQAELAANSANSTQDMAETGLETSQRNRAEVAAMKSAVMLVSEKITALSTQAAQIGDISKVVSEVAAQTNMLALNAAVEASRAGEKGKGFSVIADEIRKLADQTKSSATMTADIVEDIQNMMVDMVAAANDGKQSVEQTQAIVEEVAAVFEKVKELSEGAFSNSKQVQYNSAQQSSALSQIGTAMQLIDQGSKEVTVGSTQVRKGMQSLSEVSEDFRRLV